MSPLIRALAVATCLAQCGCASLINTFGDQREPYIGVKTDVHIIGAPWVPERQTPANLVQWPFAFVDLPFSLVMDTLLLPVTAMKPTPP